MTPEPASRSPLIRAQELAAYGDLPSPDPHTGPELSALLGLLVAAKGRVETVAIGHSRDTASRSAAEAFAAAWQARDGRVLATVDWPESAASWLRPARRLTAGEPDAWVMAAAPLGFVQLARRLRHSTDWDPARTVAFAALRDSRLPALTGPDTLHGLRGATAEGGTWAVRDRWVTSYAPTGPSAPSKSSSCRLRSTPPA
ncbi:ABC transporter substrate-binding protein [Streptomyces sp. NPDC001700]